MPMPEPKARKSAISPHRPEDWPRQFEQHLNAGDLDAVVALYEPEVRFVARSGNTVIGREPIREVLAGMIRSKTRLQSRVIKAVTVGDVALLYTDFQGTTADDLGTTVESVTRQSRSCAARTTAPGSSSWATPTAGNEEHAAICSKG